MPTIRTIQLTVANAIPIPITALGKRTSTLNMIISALEEREEQMIGRIEEVLGEGEGRIFDLLRNDGFLGT